MIHLPFVDIALAFIENNLQDFNIVLPFSPLCWYMSMGLGLALCILFRNDYLFFFIFEIMHSN